MSQRVHRRMHLRSLLALVAVVAAPRAALGGGSHFARLQYGRKRLRSPALRDPQEHAQIVDHLLEHSRFEPPPRLLVYGLPRLMRRPLSWSSTRQKTATIKLLRSTNGRPPFILDGLEHHRA